MSIKNLYIIGNGFDIYHGIVSRYSDFKKFLCNADRALHDQIEEFLPIEGNWSDLEDALADIDVDSVIDIASEFLVSYGAEKWRDSYHHDYQYEIQSIIDGLSKQLKVRFSEWVRQIRIPSQAKAASKILALDKTAQYLTFNYTSTLSTVYKIQKSNILYIHGEAHNVDQDLILGHGWNPINIVSRNDVPEPDMLDTRIMEGNELINGYFGKTFKNTESIINANQSYFNSLRNSTDIYILGHSLAHVDLDYFRKIVNSIDTDQVKWHISYYGDHEFKHHTNVMKDLGIDISKVQLLEMQKF